MKSAALAFALLLGACAPVGAQPTDTPAPVVLPSPARTAPSADARAAGLADAYGRVHRVSTAIATGCVQLRNWLPWVVAVPYGEYIGPGIQIACNTADGISRLSADPAAPLWLGEQLAIFKNAFKH